MSLDEPVTHVVAQTRATPEKYKGLPDGTVLRAVIAPELPDDVVNDGPVHMRDYELAEVFLRGTGWHSDTRKARRYQEATPQKRAWFAKCAEVRVVSAIEHVTYLRTFVLTAREAGYDF